MSQYGYCPSLIKLTVEKPRTRYHTTLLTWYCCVIFGYPFMRLFCRFLFWFSSLGHNNCHPYGFNGCPSISFSLFPFITYFLCCCCSVAKLFSRMECSTQAPLSSTVSQSRLEFMFIASPMLSKHLILCHSFCVLPSIFPSIRVFSNESALPIRWPKYWSFRFSISSSNKYSGLISFRVDCFYSLAVQGTLKILLQQHSSKASILQHSAFFMVQLSHLYMTTGKPITLTVRILSIKWHLCFLIHCLDLS